MSTNILIERKMRSFRLLQYLLQVKEELRLTDRQVYTGICMSPSTYSMLKYLSAADLTEKGATIPCRGISIACRSFW